jgi:hypothetical protein
MGEARKTYRTLLRNLCESNHSEGIVREGRVILK